MEIGQEVWVKDTIEAKRTDAVYILDHFVKNENVQEYSGQEVFDALRHIFTPETKGGMKYKDFITFFPVLNVADIFSTYTLKEIMKKMKTYEDENEIKIGDVVKLKNNNSVGVVTGRNFDRISILWNDGSVGSLHIDNLMKTEKHMDIESMLKEMDG